jgi:hypothetical protein
VLQKSVGYLGRKRWLNGAPRKTAEKTRQLTDLPSFLHVTNHVERVIVKHGKSGLPDGRRSSSLFADCVHKLDGTFFAVTDHLERHQENNRSRFANAFVLGLAIIVA